MATPAARPIQKRYTAGSCTLDVSFQPSALSQWHPKPIATDLAFKLWLQRVQQFGEQTGEPTAAEPTAGEPTADDPTVSSPEAVPPTLVAEGDRTQLQAIAQHLQRQTRQTLATPSLTAQSGFSVLPPQMPSQHSTQHPAHFPPGCLVEGPLTYLQLCDLTSVLGQYEQATQTLPVALPVPMPVSMPIQMPASQTPQQLEASAKTRQTSPDASPLTRSQNGPSKTPKDNLIPFPTTRRRPSRKLWASSAAAAIFAVGLTTTLVQTQRQFSPQPESAADLADGAAALPQTTAARPREDVAPSNERNSVTTAQEKLSAANSSVSPSQSAGSSGGAAGDSSESSTSSTASGPTNRPRTAIAPNTPPANTTAGTPSSAELADPSATANQPSPSAITPPNVVSEAVEAIPPAAAPPPSPSPSPSPAPTVTPDRSADTTGPVASIPRSAASPSIESLTLRRGAGAESEAAGSADSGSEAAGITQAPLTEPPRSVSPPPSVTNDATADDAGSIAADAPVDAETNPSPPLLQQAEPSAPSPAPTARRQATPQPSLEAPSLEAPSLEAIAPEILAVEEADSAVGETAPALSAGEAETIEKVLAYFQSKWQGNRQLAGALTYRLQLSDNGEVVSFAAVNDEAQAYRDRLIPSDRTLSFASSEFSTDEPTAPLTLRITLMPNGEVLVSAF